MIGLIPRDDGSASLCASACASPPAEQPLSLVDAGAVSEESPLSLEATEMVSETDCDIDLSLHSLRPLSLEERGALLQHTLRTAAQADGKTAGVGVERGLSEVTDLMLRVRANVVGRGRVFSTPFGRRVMTYADYTASGRLLGFIDAFLLEHVYPWCVRASLACWLRSC